MTTWLLCNLNPELCPKQASPKLKMNSDAFKCLYGGEKQTWTGHLWLLLTALMVEVCLDGSLGGPEVNTVTSCQLPPKVVSVALSHMKGRTFESKCMHSSELVRAPTATHKQVYWHAHLDPPSSCPGPWGQRVPEVKLICHSPWCLPHRQDENARHRIERDTTLKYSVWVEVIMCISDWFGFCHERILWKEKNANLNHINHGHARKSKG